MRLGTRVWGIGKFLLLVGALSLTFLVFFGLAMRMTLRAREVEVPSLAGKTVAEATRIAAALGLGLRVDDNRRSDEKIPTGQIMQQDPPPGVRTRQERTVRVWVSAGVRSTVVPALVGQTDRTARIKLEQDGIEVVSVTEVRTTRPTPWSPRIPLRRFVRLACRSSSTAARRRQRSSCRT